VRNVEPELVWIKEFLPKNAVILDIGANVGTFLYQLEKKLNHEQIYAFEPNKKLYRRLKRIFPAMRVFPLALSDENTTAEFKVPVINGKTIASRGTLNTSYKEKGEEKSYTEKVKVIRLDDWAAIENFNKMAPPLVGENTPQQEQLNLNKALCAPHHKRLFSIPQQQFKYQLSVPNLRRWI
jgi:FkbM family methyltransferase